MKPCLLLATLCALSLPAACLSQAAASTSPAVAPSAATALPPLPPAFADEPVILRDSSVVMQWNRDGTGVRTEMQAFTLQSEAALRTFGVVSLLYASASQTAEFLAVEVHHSDGSIATTPLSEVIDQTPPVTQQAPFYSDIKLKQIPVRGLRLGDTMVWRTRLTVTHPEAPNQFWGSTSFVRDLVALHQQVELRVPAGSAVNVWTNPENHLAPEQLTQGAEAVYRWQWKSLEPTVGKDAEAAKKAKAAKPLTPEEEKNETDGRLADIAYTTFPDWAAVGAWYRSLQADRVQPDTAVRAKVAQVTAGKASEQDKVRAVYDSVSSDLRYIGVAFGIGRYQPHTASAVLENQYGDCKDKHTLLASMLIALGEHPDAVLIGAGIRFNPAVPSPEAFNHLITHLTLDGKPVWLDTTAEVAPFQVLVPAIRDKDALVVPASGPARIERTPAGYPFAPYSTLAVKTSLDKNLNGESDFVFTLHDDLELGLRAGLRQLSPAQYPDGIQRMMQALGYGGTTSNPVIENLNDQEKPLVLRFHYHRDHESSWGTNRITAAVGPTNLPVVNKDEPPRVPIVLGLPHTSTSTVDVQLPEGWSAELPEAIHQQIAEARIDTTYRLDGRTLHEERKTTVLTDKVPAGEWKAYDKWFQASEAGDIPYIQLVPPATANGNAPMVETAHGDTPVAPGQVKAVPLTPKTQAERLKEAARLVSSANDKLNANDVEGAAADLAGAKALNENQEQLWGDLGVVAQRHGNQTEAMRDYRKEVELYPKSDFAWRNIVNLQWSDNRRAAAATVREWIAASPDLTEPRTDLIRLLWADGNNAGAMQAAKAAVAELPGEQREANDFQLLLGEAQLRGGDMVAGAETLSHLVQADATPLQRNDAAYELAKYHQQMPLAERTERQVLRELSAETLAWTGNESLQTMFNASNLLTASWDTMGWILHLEGKDAEAEPYVRAAWMYRPNSELGEHLGDIESALHRDRDARRTYVLANAVALKAIPDPFAELRRKSAAAIKAEPDLGALNIKDELLKERTLPVTSSAGLSGSASYIVLFHRDGVISAKPTPATTTPVQDDAVRTAKFSGFFPAGESAALVGTFKLTCKDGNCSLAPGN